MKNLKEYLNEGLKDWSDDKFKSIMDKEDHIMDYITSNYQNLNPNKLKINRSTPVYTVDYEGDIRVPDGEITDGSFKWGVVKGDFSVVFCRKLTSLEGCPDVVEGRFQVIECYKLKSLKGSPNEVNNFQCKLCELITDLKGCPKIIDGKMSLLELSNLKSLKGCPSKIGKNFEVLACYKLESLDGGPKEVGGSYDCSSCRSLKSLEGAPKKINGDLICDGCNGLESLKGVPEEIKGDFDLRGTENNSNWDSFYGYIMNDNYNNIKYWPKKIDGDVLI